MKTLRNRVDTDEILRRLQHVRPESPPKWGRMTAHQMVCHLADGFRLYMGDRPSPMISMRVPRAVLKTVALWMPLPWPHGFQTMPEMDQQGGGGTKPQQFADDVHQLQALTERFVQLPRDFRWPPHPHFGKLTYTEWMRLAYLHAHHHLRQFGA